MHLAFFCIIDMIKQKQCRISGLFGAVMEDAAMAVRTIWTLIKAAAHNWSADKVPKKAAALAYYTMMSLSPLLVLMVAVLEFFLVDAREEVIRQVERVIGPVGKAAALQVMEHTAREGRTGLAALLSGALLLFGATAVFVELQDSLDAIWKVKLKPGQGILAVLRKRLFSLVLVLGSAFLLLVSLVVSTIITTISAYMTGNTELVGYGVDLLFSIGSITFLFAAVFKFLPDAKIAWQDVWLGAFVTAVLFTIGKIALSFYFAKSSPASAYGAAGSLAAFLVWVYYSAQILFFGAELTQAYACRWGRSITPADGAVVIGNDASGGRYRRPI